MKIRRIFVSPAGPLLAAASSQMLAGLLYRVSPVDVPTFALVFVLVLGCSATGTSTALRITLSN